MLKTILMALVVAGLLLSLGLMKTGSLSAYLPAPSIQVACDQVPPPDNSGTEHFE
jgi:hypothetical protein